MKSYNPKESPWQDIHAEMQISLIVTCAIFNQVYYEPHKDSWKSCFPWSKKKITFGDIIGNTLLSVTQCVGTIIVKTWVGGACIVMSLQHLLHQSSLILIPICEQIMSFLK